MKTTAVALIFLSSTAHAGIISYPPNCNNQRTGMEEAFCKDSEVPAKMAEDFYLNARKNANTFNKFKELIGIRAPFRNSYNTCAMLGVANAISDCLNPVFATIFEVLPVPDDIVGRKEAINAATIADKSSSVFASGLASNCVIRSISALDDGVSPASEIAKVATSECKLELDAAADVFLETLSPSLFFDPPTLAIRNDFISTAFNPDRFVPGVLQYRAGQRAKKQSKSNSATTSKPKKTPM